MRGFTPFTLSTRRAVSVPLLGVLAGGTALALVPPVLASPQAAGTPVGTTVSTSERGTGERAPGTGTDERPRHASDGKEAWIAPPQPAGRVRTVVRQETGWNMAPGIDYRTWEQVDGARKPVRAHLVTIDTTNPDVSLDLISPPKVSTTWPVSWMVSKSGAVAGINGDFFDISDTGAPLGVGRARKKGVRHGPRTGWNSTFWIDKQGRPHIGELKFRGKVRGTKPAIQFTNLNSPVVAKAGIGLYTPAWGRTRGLSVTDGQKRARQVVIKKGRVVANRFGLTTGKKVRGRMLVGRGRSAKVLKRLRKGDRVKLRWWVTKAPKVAISGDRPLLVDGKRVVINDRLMHPRTAVGIDADAHKIYFLTIDGRQKHSRGYTMVELANMMLALGAENALNLDGGGSTTLVGHTDAGELGVLNAPSDGGERRVPNGLGVFSDPRS